MARKLVVLTLVAEVSEDADTELRETKAPEEPANAEFFARYAEGAEYALMPGLTVLRAIGTDVVTEDQ